MAERWRLPRAVRYLLPRLVVLAAAWLLATVAIFILLFEASDPIDHFRFFADQDRAAYRHELGLDKPSYELYGDWLDDLAHGDLGIPSYYRSSVASALRHRTEPTVELLVLGLVFGYGGGLGIRALRRRRMLVLGDILWTGPGALPIIVFGSLVFIIPLSLFDYLPPIHFAHLYRDPWGNLRQVVPPATIIGLAVAAVVARNAPLPMSSGRTTAAEWSTGLARMFAVAISAIVIAEPIFDIPGLGCYLFQSVFNSQMGSACSGCDWRQTAPACS